MIQSPKEKAEELVRKFMEYTPADMEYEFPYAVECAKIAVDEIIEAIDWHEFETPNKELEYWQEVKQELEKM